MVILIKNTILFIVSIALSLTCSQASAQTNIVPLWEFSSSVVIYEKGDLNFFSGTSQLETRSTPSYQFDIKKRWRIGEVYAISVDATVGKIGYTLAYDFPKEKYPELPFSVFSSKHTSRVYPFGRIGLCFEYLFYHSDKLAGCISVSGGLKYVPTSFSDFNSSVLDSTNTLTRTIVFISNSVYPGIIPDCSLRYSEYYALGKKLRLSASLFYSYSFSDVVRGNFTLFPDTPSRTTGTFSLSGSCAGLCIGIGM